MQMEPIKVLLVDDDTIVRRGLKATIDWEKYGMVVVADAPNGKRGWEEFITHHPDIVITDIVMPEENGLELSKKVKAHSPESKILLLSCHKDFEYAQEGLKLGASGYLLKTDFDDQEIDHFLSEFQQEIRNKKGNMDNDSIVIQESFLLWLNGYENDFEQTLNILFRKGWSWMNDSYHVFFIQNPPESCGTIFNHSPQSVTLHFGRQAIFFFIEDTCHKEFLTNLTEARVEKTNLNWIQAGPLQGKQDWMKIVTAMHHIQNQTDPLTDYPTGILLAVEYIVRNLSYPMTVSDIASAVKMSRSHLSTLFKKTMGISIHSFIDKKRLQLSKQLLMGSTLNVQEVGEQIGIQDSKYFSKWFKRCVGLTPTNYRIEQKDE